MMDEVVQMLMDEVVQMLMDEVVQIDLDGRRSLSSQPFVLIRCR